MGDRLFTGTNRNHTDLSLSTSRAANAVILTGDRLGLLFEALPCYLGKKIDSKPEAKGAALKFFRWLSDLATVFSFITGSLIRCTIGVFASLLDLAAAPCRRTLYAVGSSLVSMIVLPCTLMLGLIQRMLLLQSPLERLGVDERTLADTIFGRRQWLEEVRMVKTRFGLFGSISSSFVLGNLIILKSGARHILVHELVHVWQYRSVGARYAGNALLAQWIYGRNQTSGHAYDWQCIAAETGPHWLSLNAEAGAQLIEDTYGMERRLLTGSQSLLIDDAYSCLRGDPT